jgi:hypothetical protein
MAVAIQDAPMKDAQMLDPEDQFESPAAVLAADDLSRADKIAILVNWANDIRLQQVAQEENMPGGAGLGERLRAVEDALLALGHEDGDHDAKA